MQPQWNPHGVTRHEAENLIVEYLVVGPFQENSYLLRRPDSTQTVLIDPGDEVERLLAQIEREKLEPIAIINTHAHLDHIGAIVPLQQRFELPFYLHDAELPVLQMAPLAARMFGVPAPELPTVDRALQIGEPLQLAGLDFELRFTPGHSPGSVTFLVGGVAIAGDVLFYGSIGRTDLPGGDYDTLIQSIERQLMSLDDETVVFSGHGPHTTVGRERRLNPFLQG
ncbi:MAG: MBL fold metallo-hydrolase [Myxococcales bacterium]|nr:MBL fold metallo-hydrolase [Myxococcales bacterium]